MKLVHNTVRRTALAVAGVALVAGGLTACGGDDGGGDDGGSGSAAPDNTTEKDFCAAYGKYVKELSTSVGSDGDTSALVPTLKKLAASLSKLGTPDGIPEDARRGFEISIDAINDLPDDATQDDLMKAGKKYDAADQKDAAAFGTYVQDTCKDLLPTS